MDEIPFPKVKTWRGQDTFYYQEKRDGHCIGVYRDKDGTMSVLTRTPGIDLWDQLKDIPRLPFFDIPPDSIVFGELFVENGFATGVKTAINERSPDLRFECFAIPRIDGYDWTDKDELSSIGYIADVAHDIGVPFIPYAASYTPFTEDQVSCLLETAKAKGIEGYVLKQSHMEGWYKIKVQRTIDAVVMVAKKSFSDQHFGGLKSIIVGLYLPDGSMKVIADVGSGFSAEYRADVRLKDLEGRVAEVLYDDVAQQGKLKFPRFLRWRDDKPARECTMESLLG